VADAVDLQQGPDLWILSLVKLLDQAVVVLDLECHLCDLFEHRPQCQLESWLHRGLARWAKHLLDEAGMR
jgi:hypothetical protein